MSDIVERLRTWREDAFPCDPSKEAADEIERLQAALASRQAQEPVAWRRYEAFDNESAGWELHNEPVEGGQPLYAAPPINPARQMKLHPATQDLIERFASALTDKLEAAERKYGYSDGWLASDWMDECREKLVEHVAKGDPRDVAAYCAFLWHHGERTTALQSSARQMTQEELDGLQKLGWVPTICPDCGSHSAMSSARQMTQEDLAMVCQIIKDSDQTTRAGMAHEVEAHLSQFIGSAKC